MIEWKDSLLSLNISKNHIAELPTFITNLKKIKSLILNSNDFDTLPINFVTMKDHLKEFSIDWLKYCIPVK